MNSIEQLNQGTYATRDEWIEDLQNPRYRSDPGFQAAVEAKFTRSYAGMTGRPSANVHSRKTFERFTITDGLNAPPASSTLKLIPEVEESSAHVEQLPGGCMRVSVKSSW